MLCATGQDGRCSSPLGCEAEQAAPAELIKVELVRVQEFPSDDGPRKPKAGEVRVNKNLPPIEEAAPRGHEKEEQRTCTACEVPDFFTDCLRVPPETAGHAGRKDAPSKCPGGRRAEGVGLWGEGEEPEELRSESLEPAPRAPGRSAEKAHSFDSTREPEPFSCTHQAPTPQRMRAPSPTPADSRGAARGNNRLWPEPPTWTLESGIRGAAAFGVPARSRAFV